MVLTIGGCTTMDEKWHDGFWGGKGLEDAVAYFTVKRGRAPLNMVSYSY
jgi:hypothetical protein